MYKGCRFRASVWLLSELRDIATCPRAESYASCLFTRYPRQAQEARIPSCQSRPRHISARLESTCASRVFFRVSVRKSSRRLHLSDQSTKRPVCKGSGRCRNLSRIDGLLRYVVRSLRLRMVLVALRCWVGLALCLRNMQTGCISPNPQNSIGRSRKARPNP